MSLRKRILRNPRVLVSGSIVLVLVLSAILAPVLAPHDPYKVYSKHAYGLPSPEFPLGNDDFGRDILSRLLYGARISLRVAFSAVIISLLIGVMLGLSSGYYGGMVDTIIMRSMDVILSFPTIVLAIAVIAFLGNSLTNVILVIALLNVPRFARITYSSTQSVKHNQYVEASRAIGAQDWRLLSRGILPNILAPLFVAIALTLGAAILVESGLSFLGLGVPPPEPSWGTMVSSARMIMDVHPTMVIWPSLVLAITVLSFNTLGNGLRDALDPRLREA
jgi:ABC-type dipeptide/oligopeptide/nickel transport system permease subunit